MEGAELGMLVFYIALAIFLLFFVYGAATGQYNLLDKLGEILMYR